MTLREEIERQLSHVCNGLENGSNTPDFILGSYLLDCLAAFDRATRNRETWYGRDPDVGPAGIKLGDLSI